MKMNVIKIVNRNQRAFSSRGDAETMAMALADFSARGGRFLVIDAGAKHKVVWDECKVRDGVNEGEVVYEVSTNCNSGTLSWRECYEGAFRFD